MAQMPATSNEDVGVFWGTAADGLPVQIAIIVRTADEDEPVDADYHDAEWDDGNPGWATLHIGAGSPVELAEGEYVIWTRLTAGTRRPVRRSGLLTIGTP
ncbi:hypothetical protein AB0J28_00610 [Streptosporangium canum]|uniref:hypothetical protein n=1 Tax=Streptosporangium canum TaxID=324952 RepID=UPI00344551A2